MDTQLSILVTTHVFLLYVSMIDTYVISIMSFTVTVVVHISIVNVVHTFVPCYKLSLLPILLP